MRKTFLRLAVFAQTTGCPKKERAAVLRETTTYELNFKLVVGLDSGYVNARGIVGPPPPLLREPERRLSKNWPAEAVCSHRQIQGEASIRTPPPNLEAAAVKFLSPISHSPSPNAPDRLTTSRYLPSLSQNPWPCDARAAALLTPPMVQTVEVVRFGDKQCLPLMASVPPDSDIES
ncbi:hypothetical protein PHLGIDRAFT_503914 [Phlebiopsis gigantea 11061_1 CR5-6]|uniref:Uncharacterized protein n=1 Tax=Phlebiopsis gigantea (strain 11061_1 CR5-6) TaxID=745531 RepID=A0A0C3S2M7_PHLG1|nr:hypothetical protein PHLGIDRAFT_503914 [Phlebiopsis gigantea 11061_1 CR5-6]